MDMTTEILIYLIIGLILTGAFAGILAGLLGVGGGIVIVPVLYHLFTYLGIQPDISMSIAVGSSLATIIPTSISSARSHHKKGAIDLDLFKLWAPWLFVGAAVGGVLSKVITGTQLTGIFGVIAFLVAINMIVPGRRVIANTLPKGQVPNAGMSSGIGIFSALMGIGGGTLSVPALTAFSYPIHKAVGTAAAFGFVIAVPAMLGFVWGGLGVEGRPPFSLGYVNMAAVIIIFSATIFTAPIGAKVAHRINAKVLKKVFGVFLGLTAIKMLLTLIM